MSSADNKELIGSQREKRPAPTPPGRNVAATPREQEVPSPHQQQLNKQSNEREAGTASTTPWCSVEVKPSNTGKTESFEKRSFAKETETVAKHGKRPAPSRPASRGGPQHGGSGTRQAAVRGLNPFEDDEDEVTSPDDTAPCGSTSSAQWPPSMTGAADEEDAASQAKLKSSKMSHAPPPPAAKVAPPPPTPTPTTSSSHGPTGLRHGSVCTSEATPERASNPDLGSDFESRACSVPDTSLAESPSAGAEEAAVKKNAPPVNPRR